MFNKGLSSNPWSGRRHVLAELAIGCVDDGRLMIHECVPLIFGVCGVLHGKPSVGAHPKHCHHCDTDDTRKRAGQEECVASCIRSTSIFRGLLCGIAAPAAPASRKARPTKVTSVPVADEAFRAAVDTARAHRVKVRRVFAFAALPRRAVPCALIAVTSTKTGVTFRSLPASARGADRLGFGST